MTLILNRASKDYVLQVTDRLVTRNSSPFDPFSNKNIIFVARNAIVTIAYTGYAYLGGITTDQWIVEKLTGHIYKRESNPFAMHIGKLPYWLDIGRALQILKKELDQAQADVRRVWRQDWFQKSFDVSVVGWQWNNRGCVRPIVASISKAPNSNPFKLEYESRYWYFGRYGVSAAPSTNITIEQFKRLNTDLYAKPADTAEAIMVGMMREISKKSRVVGPNCLSILLPPPWTRRARVRYLATEAVRTSLVTSTDVHEFSTAFSPWIVGGGGIHAPSMLGGAGWSIVTGQFTVQIDGFEYPRATSFMKSQKRPKLPE